MSTLQTTNLKHPDSATNNIRFDSSGRVGFGGADTPVGVVTIYDSTNAYLYFQNSASGTSGGDGFSILHHSSLDTFIANRDNGDIALEAGGAEALRIKSDRRVALGTSAPPNTADLTVRAANPELSLYASANFSSYLMMGDTDDYDNGFIEYDNHDPNKFMKFVTNAGERLRITQDGVIKHTGIRGGGGENKLAQYVVPSHNTNEEDVLVFQAENESASNQLTFGGGTSSFNAATKIRFLTAASVDTTAGTERMRIESNGKLSLGTYFGSSSAFSFYNIWGQGVAGGMDFNHANAISAGRADVIYFRHQGTIVGEIDMDNNDTAYRTTSDYRLKENQVVIADGIQRVKQLNAYRFNWISSPAKTVDGFFAHEAQAVVPEAVSGTHDAVDDEGNPVYQGIDQSKLVPLLTAALQEAIAKIETLETKVAALEAG